MGRLVLILFFVVFGYASKILNISYFPSNEKVDILFSLDEPFKGKISLLQNNNYKISNISFNRIEQKKFNSNLNVVISSLDKNSIEVKIISKYKVKIRPSVTSKGYGLRLRLTGFPKKEEKINFTQSNQPQTNFNFVNYIIVIIILLILIVVLLIIKKKALQKLPKSLQNDNYNLLYQKHIDPKNRLVLIEVFGKRYLLLLGDKNNILLDDFSKNHQEELKDISTQNGFDSLLQEKLNEDEYIKKASELKEFE